MIKSLHYLRGISCYADKKIARVVFALSVLFGQNITGQQFFSLSGTEPAAMGHAAAAVSSSWSVFGNVAAVTEVSSFSVGASYDQKFSLNQFSTKSAFLIAPFRPGVLSVAFTYYGFSLYNESTFSAGFSRKFGQKVSAGVQLSLLSAKLNPVEPALFTATVSASVFARLSNNFSMGFVLQNIPASRFKTETEPYVIPVYYRLGMAWKDNGKWLVSADVSGQNGSDPSFHAGLKYELVPNIDLLCGFETNPLMPSLGVQYRLAGLQFGVSCSVHNKLGKLWNCGATYQF